MRQTRGSSGPRPGAAPLSVTFVASTLAVGGTETMVREYALRMDRRRFTPSVVCLKGPGRIGEELAARGVPVVSGVAASRLGLSGLGRLRATLRARRAQAVVCLDHRNAMTLGVVASLGVVRKRFVTVHSTRLWSGKKILGGSVGYAMRFVDRVIAVGPNQARYLVEEEGVRSDRIAVVPNGIDAAEFEANTDAAEARGSLGLGPDCRVAGIVAALRPEKNHELFLEAAARVLRAVPGARFLVVGGGSRREKLERLAAGLGLADAVSFLGERGDARSIIRAFDVAVLCSHPVVETLPVFVMEAMAWGKPVVSTRVGDVESLVEDGVTGLLVPPGSVEELAGAVGRLLTDPETARRMGRRGRDKVVSEFSLDSSVRVLEDLLEGELRKG
ncbi:MAG: glycosyltransferase [Candidatus Eisenbacteria bacterium]|nr:glycosyltransferase [Candidatus Eisenbacteria bacterium]